MADHFRYVAFALLGVLVLVILVQADSVITSGEAVGRSMRYDMALTGLNSRLDATNARERMARYVVTGDSEDRDAAYLFYDILVGRLEMMQSGAFGAFVKASPRRQKVLDEATRAVIAVEPMLDLLPDPAAFEQVNKALGEAGTAIDRLGGEAMSANLSEAAEFRAELSERQRVQNLLLQLLIGFGAGLLLMMTVQAEQAASSSCGNDENGVLQCSDLTDAQFNIALGSPAWNNRNRGGAGIAPGADGAAVLTVNTGRLSLPSDGAPLTLGWRLLLTPVRGAGEPVRADFATRYFHMQRFVPVEEALRATPSPSIILHQGNQLNPYINYPFLTINALRAYISEAHAVGAKVKLYYTVRELSTSATEL